MTILKHVKRGHHADFATLCPRCGSKNIHDTIGQPANTYSLRGMYQNGYCDDCFSHWINTYKFAYWEFVETYDSHETMEIRIQI